MNKLFKTLITPLAMISYSFLLLLILTVKVGIHPYLSIIAWITIIYLFWVNFLLKSKVDKNKKILLLLLSFIITPIIPLLMVSSKARQRVNPVKSPFGLTLLIIIIFIVSQILLVFNEENGYTGFVQDMERTVSTIKYKFRGSMPVSNKVSIVDVDDATLEKYGWPLNRTKYAEIITNLKKLGAKVIAFDIVFPDAGNSDSIVIAKDFYEKFNKISLSSKDGLVTKLEDIINEEESNLKKLKKQVTKINNKIKNLQARKEVKKDGENRDKKVEIDLEFKKDLNKKIKKLNKEYNSVSKTISDSQEAIKKYKIVFEQLKVLNDQYGEHLNRKALEIFPDKIFSKAIHETGNVVLGYLGYGNPEDAKKGISSDLQKQNLNAILSYELNQGRILEGIEPIKFEKLPFRELYGLQTPYKDIVWLNPPLPKSVIEKAKKQIETLEEIPDELLEILDQEDGTISTNYFGAFNLIPDIDGIARNYYPAFRIKDGKKTKIIFSLGLTALKVYFHDPKNEADDFLIKREILGQGAASKRYYFDFSGKKNLFFGENQSHFVLNYYGPMNTFKYISLKDVLENKLTDEQINKYIKGKIILIGTSASGLLDLRATPFDPGQKYPGVEIHATFIENVLNDNFFKRPATYQIIEILMLIFLGFLLGVIIYNSPILVGFIFAVFITFIIFWIDLKFFFSEGYQLYSFHHMIQPIVIFISITVLRYFREEKEKQMIKHTFKHYLSQSVVDDVLKNPKKLTLGGERKVLSVLFSDIRGFTTISEGLTSEELSDLMNEYLTPMTQCVFDYDGTLDKYMGDAIMAFFGAPIEQADHAVRACETALKMMRDLATLNKALKSKGRPTIDIGIGINSGEMSVGNMGSTQRFDYTVMGDHVNLGSRLEAINKQYKTNIIISEYTYEMVKNIYSCRLLDSVRVKGKKLPVTIYELIGPKKEDEFLNLSEKAINLYYAREWDKAIAIFNELKSQKEDYLSDKYIERCNNYKINPPSEDWDGAYTMTTK